VLADHPTPIKGAARMSFDLKTGRFVWRAPPEPGATLPSFRGAIPKLQTK